MLGPTFLCCVLLAAAVQGSPAKQDIHQHVHHDDVSSGGARIMGGTPASQGQFSFQVALITKDGVDPDGFCGGMLISPTVVLTAAHCIFTKTQFEVILGTLRCLDTNSFGRVVVASNQKVVHEDFNYAYGLNNDIGLIILPSPVVLTSTIQPILLPRRRDQSETFVGRTGRATGWGKTGDAGGFINEDMLFADVLIVDNQECVNAYGSNYVPPTKMCLSTNGGTVGPCNGDSGGPLFLTNSAGEQIVVGITSFGASAGCEVGYPEVDTRITSFLDWIAANGGPPVRL